MAQVDFYSISEPDEQSRLFFACRLVEKAMGQGLKIYIHTDNEQVAMDMDDLLWSFKPESFIPHAIVGIDVELGDDDEVPVFIGYFDKAPAGADLLINLGNAIPPFLEDFPRIAEIVPNAEDAKANLRAHWTDYKARGLALNHHQL
jgi:DNA polymerase-3 subunit chi